MLAGLEYFQYGFWWPANRCFAVGQNDRALNENGRFDHGCDQLCIAQSLITQTQGLVFGLTCAYQVSGSHIELIENVGQQLRAGWCVLVKDDFGFYTLVI